jgi:hypothetical protein
MVMDRWTPAEHLAFNQDIMESLPLLSSKVYHDGVSLVIFKRIAELNNNKIS